MHSKEENTLTLITDGEKLKENGISIVDNETKEKELMPSNLVFKFNLEQLFMGFINNIVDRYKLLIKPNLSYTLHIKIENEKDTYPRDLLIPIRLNDVEVTLDNLDTVTLTILSKEFKSFIKHDITTSITLTLNQGAEFQNVSSIVISKSFNVIFSDEWTYDEAEVNKRENFINELNTEISKSTADLENADPELEEEKLTEVDKSKARGQTECFVHYDESPFLTVFKISATETNENIPIDEKVQHLIDQVNTNIDKTKLENVEVFNEGNITLEITIRLMRLSSDIIKRHITLVLSKLPYSTSIKYIDLPVVEDSFDITTPNTMLNVIADFDTGRIFDIVFDEIPNDRIGEIVNVFAKDAKVYSFRNVSLEEILLPQFMVMVYMDDICKKFSVSNAVAALIGEAFTSIRITYIETFLKRGLVNEEIDLMVKDYQSNILQYMESIDFNETDEIRSLLTHVTSTAQGMQSDIQAFAKAAGEVADIEHSKQKDKLLEQLAEKTITQPIVS